MKRIFFELRYLLGNAPWDTGISPPELLEFLQQASPGRALELGCGTGTNAITMATQGWEVTGVDFSALAIWAARRKARRQGLDIRFMSRNVANLDGLASPFDFALDIGCLHGLAPQERLKYASALGRLIAADGVYLLYSFITQEPDPIPQWPTAEEIDRLFGRDFSLVSAEYGRDGERTSAWFKFNRHQT